MPTQHATPHYSVRRVNRRKKGRTAKRAVQYAERGGPYASRADDVLGRGRAGPDLGDWSVVDAAEWRKDAVVARTRIANVPHELSLKGKMRVGQTHVDWMRSTFCIAGGFTLQAPSGKPGSDPRNTHFHFYDTTRVVDDQGNLGKKVRRLDLAHTVYMARQNYEDCVNAELRREKIAIRLDLRSFEKQGRREKPLSRVPIIEFQRGRRGEPDTPLYDLNQAQLRHRANTTATDESAAQLDRIRRDITARFLGRRSAGGAAGGGTSGRALDTARPGKFASGEGLSTPPPDRTLPDRDDGGRPETSCPMAATRADDQRRLGTADAVMDGGRIAGANRGRDRGAATLAGTGGMGGREADPLAPALIKIVTSKGGTFYAWAEDIKTARANGSIDVPLSRPDGEPVVGAVGRGSLRLSTIDASILTYLTLTDVKPADEKLLDKARQKVDLAGYLAARGWTAGNSDSQRWRQMDGPGGQRLLVRQTKEKDEWVWTEAHDQNHWRTLYDLVKHLDGGTHGQTMAAVRRAAATPPPPPGLGRGGRTSTDTASGYQPRPPRTLLGLDEEGMAYLTGTRALAPDTVAAFAQELRSLPGGTVVAVHNAAHDGEQKGPAERGQFYGGLDDMEENGPARGRSLWIAQSHDQGVPEQLAVTDAFLDAMSVWECLDPSLQPTVAVASTGGKPSAAATEKLKRALARMVEAHGERITPVLLDASDVGEEDEERRAAWLRGVAAAAGVEYRRHAPGAKDWNEYLANAKHEAHEAAIAAEEVQDYPPPSDEPDETQDGQDTPRRGRGR